MAKPSLKRGISGQANAASQPFRINGWAPDWQARKLNVNALSKAPSSGSRTMQGLVGGFLAESLGLGRVRGDYERAVAHAQTRVTHPLLRDDEQQREAAE
ncbi:hypothetical protein JQ628_11485 [Bradyrhizobium lablabi]|uniref:hypothetical protein n=1 Tax=Bradyrhizobium lablabi TaxID=722472 RepID=UPI001BAA02BC|nr:hypothetical protein [Bradyrhizobium lablabi]MBR1122138.1 hypothetical protein [Bradyrhizobium lablabi]